MKKSRFSHIRKWLLLYLIAVLVTTFAIFALIFVEIDSILDSVAKTLPVIGEAGNASLPAAISAMRLRMLLVTTGGLLGLGVLGYVWMGLASHRLVRPMRRLARALAQLARGKLNETVDITQDDEFGQMGAGINELAANLQELLLYIWKQTGQCLVLLDRIQQNPDMQHDRRLSLETLGYLKQLTEAVDDLREMAKAYVFYDVSLEGNNARAIQEPGKTSPSDN